MCVSPKYTYKKYIKLFCCFSCCWVGTTMLRMWGTSMTQKVKETLCQAFSWPLWEKMQFWDFEFVSC